MLDIKVSRRRLLAGAIGAVPLGAVSGRLVSAAATAPADPMLRHFLDTIIDNHNAIKRDGLRAEHVRRHAAAVRALAIYGASNRRWDDEVRASVANGLGRYGRDGLIARLQRNPAPCEPCNRQLESEGLDLGALPPPVGELTPAIKSKAIDRLGSVGITPVLRKEADVLDRRARHVEQVFGMVLAAARTPRARRVQDACDDIYMSLFDPPAPPLLRPADCTDTGGGGTDCSSWSLLVIEKDTATAVCCFDPLLAEICPVMIANDAAVRLMAWWAGC